MILGELEKNYNQIKDMHHKLIKEEREDQTLSDRLCALEKNPSDTALFDYIRNVIDERNALINEYELNLKN